MPNWCWSTPPDRLLISRFDLQISGAGLAARYIGRPNFPSSGLIVKGERQRFYRRPARNEHIAGIG
jgi:hypothetical protein